MVHPRPVRRRPRRTVVLAALAVAAIGSIAAAPADDAPERSLRKAPPVEAPGDGTVRPLGLSWL